MEMLSSEEITVGSHHPVQVTALIEMEFAVLYISAH